MLRVCPLPPSLVPPIIPRHRPKRQNGTLQPPPPLLDIRDIDAAWLSPIKASRVSLSKLHCSRSVANPSAVLRTRSTIACEARMVTRGFPKGNRKLSRSPPFQKGKGWRCASPGSQKNTVFIMKAQAKYIEAGARATFRATKDRYCRPRKYLGPQYLWFNPFTPRACSWRSIPSRFSTK